MDGRHVRNIVPRQLLVYASMNIFIDTNDRTQTSVVINHAPTPNTEPRWLLWSGVLCCALVALRRIVGGEQLVYSYGEHWARARGIDERDLVADSAPGRLPGYLPLL
jgi:hypothetical protein